MQQTSGLRTNALRREFVVGAVATGRASAEQVYDVLAELRSHLTWGGEHQPETGRLLSIDAPAGPATVGTEFATTGSDPMGRFADRSVVTGATRPSEFEFVTESRLETKRGRSVEWTNVHRYQLAPTPEGCRVEYTLRITRVSALPGMLRLFNSRLLSGVARKAAAGVGRRGVQNLLALAEKR